MKLFLLGMNVAFSIVLEVALLFGKLKVGGFEVTNSLFAKWVLVTVVGVSIASSIYKTTQLV